MSPRYRYKTTYSNTTLLLIQIIGFFIFSNLFGITAAQAQSSFYTDTINCSGLSRQTPTCIGGGGTSGEGIIQDGVTY